MLTRILAPGSGHNSSFASPILQPENRRDQLNRIFRRDHDPGTGIADHASDFATFAHGRDHWTACGKIGHCLRGKYNVRYRFLLGYKASVRRSKH